MVGLVDLIYHNQAYIREIINGSLMIACAWCAAICALYVVQSWKVGDPHWREHLGTRVACALAWVFGIESYRTGSVWNVYFTAGGGGPTNIGAFATVNFVQTLGYLVGGFLLVVVILWCTYLFSPDRFARHLWKYSLSSILWFLALAAFFKHLKGN
jgi:hypothetical protein